MIIMCDHTVVGMRGIGNLKSSDGCPVRKQSTGGYRRSRTGVGADEGRVCVTK